MKTTLRVIKADIGSIGGHLLPSRRLVERVREFVAAGARDLIQDHRRRHRDQVRAHVARKAIDMRRQGFSGAAMVPMAELAYTGVVEMLKSLDQRFTVRVEGKKAAAA